MILAIQSIARTNWDFRMGPWTIRVDSRSRLAELRRFDPIFTTAPDEALEKYPGPARPNGTNQGEGDQGPARKPNASTTNEFKGSGRQMTGRPFRVGSDGQNLPHGRHLTKWHRPAIVWKEA